MTQSFGSEALARWGLLELVQREERRDVLMAAVPLPAPAVLEVLRSQWSDRHGEDAEQWCARLGARPADFDALVAREWRWAAWCEQRFAASVASTFLRRKVGLDQVCFWQLDVQDADLASELYLRLREGETSMQQLHAQRCGPVALEQLPAPLRAVLLGMRVDAISAPMSVGSTWQLLWLQQRLPAALDEPMRKRLLLEMGEQLLNREPTPKP
jgi:hypothetical protein